MSFDPLASVLSVTEAGGRTAVRFAPGTALDGANVEAIGARLTALAEERSAPHLTLDLGGVTLITSVALGKLLRLNGRVRATGGRLVLVNPNPTVGQVFRVSRLDTVLDIRAVSQPLSA
jgi:anti-sigma B factor antagonist